MTIQNTALQAVPDLDLLTRAIQNGSTLWLQEWLKLGFDLNDPRLASPKFSDNGRNFPCGTPVLLHAIENSDDEMELVRSLLEGGADPNRHIDNRSGLTALLIADDLPMIELLVAHGADVNAADFNEIRPVHKAIVEGHLDRLIFLHQKGARLDVLDMNGDHLLLLATSNPPICQWLITQIPELLNEPRGSGVYGYETPLLRAIRNFQSETAQLLVGAGAKTKGMAGGVDAADLAEQFHMTDLANWIRGFEAAQSSANAIRSIAKASAEASPSP